MTTGPLSAPVVFETNKGVCGLQNAIPCELALVPSPERQLSTESTGPVRQMLLLQRL